MKVQFFLSSMFQNHSITLAEFFHWLTCNNLTKCWFIFSKIDLLTLPNNWFKSFYHHQISFKNKGHSTDTTLSKYIWEVMRKLKIMPSLKWYIIKFVPAYSNISNKCQLCLQEKFEILNYPNPNELFNKRSELISKCRHVNKILLSNYKSND